MDGIKIISIERDQSLFTEGSLAWDRAREYGKLVEEMHIIVFSKKSSGLKEKKIGENVFVYPTNSISGFFYASDAASLGKKLVFERKFVRGRSVIAAEDPFECGLAGLKIKNKWRLPLEVEIHADPSSSYFKESFSALQRKMCQRVMNEADTIRVSSKFLGQKVADLFSKGEAIFVLPAFVDREKIENGQVVFDLHARFGWHFIMLSVAELTSVENLSMALQVLARLRTYFPDTGLILVGSGPEEPSLRSLAKTLNLEQYVAFVGHVEALTSYYRTSNLYIQTSRFEDRSQSLVEAGLSGLPVVSTPVGIANDLENGKDLYVCPQDDVEYMFKAVYDLLENNQKRESLKINMKRSLDQMLISKEDYIKSLVENWHKTASKVSVA